MSLLRAPDPALHRTAVAKPVSATGIELSRRGGVVAEARGSRAVGIVGYTGLAQSRAYRFAPTLGNWRMRFNAVVAAFSRGQSDGLATTTGLLAELNERPRDRLDADSSAAALALALLADIVAAGGSAVVRDSAVWVSWPRWDASDLGGDGLRQALIRLRSQPVTYRPPVSLREAIGFVSEMSIETRVVDSTESVLAGVFRSGLTTWSMPYRGREGRSRRFVVIGRARDRELPIGILEVGDDAPHNPARDLLCGFAVSRVPAGEVEAVGGYGRTLKEWVHDRGTFAADDLADRLTRIRHLLRPVPDVDPSASLSHLVGQMDWLRLAGVGRSGSREEIDQRKRYAYLARLVSGEVALRQRDLEGSGARDAVRVLHDLTVPRIQVEATICGALPPFGQVLGGKLMATLLGHPSIRAVVDREIGDITQRLFDPRVETLLPRHGALVVTTKGLFHGHSAQYNNVRLPGRAASLKLNHLTNTVGSTTSLLSDQVGRWAEQLLALHGPDSPISREFGSGGGKRQRTIEAAALAIGLPEQIVHAQVRRPVYAATFVSNLVDVALLNEDPEWLIDPQSTGAAYDERSLSLWRERWMPVIERRAAKVSRD